MIELLWQALIVTGGVLGILLGTALYVAAWLWAIHKVGQAYYFKETILPMILIVVLLYGGVFACLATLPHVPVKAEVENVST
jgi:ABC-type amino acid transport system permease subunit